jgi:hypothetical protein
MRISVDREVPILSKRFSALTLELFITDFIALVVHHHVVVVVRLCLVVFLALVAAKVGAISDVILVVLDEGFRRSDGFTTLAHNARKAIVDSSSVGGEEVHFFEDFIANVATKPVKKIPFSGEKLKWH